ncbi:MAG: PepSY-associated TM helix domain-containing protein [Opitutus sp.]
MKFRNVLFWVHLIAGLVSGLVIAVMCFTGTALAFEKQLVAWSERDARYVATPPHESKLSLDEMAQRLRLAQPESRPSAINVSADPHEAVTFALGRDANAFVNPYTGEVRTPNSTTVRTWMRSLTDWHRYLALSGDQRPIGKLINGISNLAFFVLAVTGLYLWMPRQWSWSAVRAVSTFNPRLKGRGRDFNWHNVIGLWSAPVLIVLTLSAIPISFRWGSTMVYRIVGEEPPAQPAPGLAANAPVLLPPVPPGTNPLDRQAQFVKVQTAFPKWEQITLRLAGPARPEPAREGRTPSTTAGASPQPENRPRQNAPLERAADASAPTLRANGTQPLVFTVKTSGAWPRTATTTVTMNPFSGDIVRQESFADQSAGRRLRGWTRFLHTGEALGLGGQLGAGLASFGGCFLVYTGTALACRRFFGKRSDSPRG